MVPIPAAPPASGAGLQARMLSSVPARASVVGLPRRHSRCRFASHWGQTGAGRSRHRAGDSPSFLPLGLRAAPWRPDTATPPRSPVVVPFGSGSRVSRNDSRSRATHKQQRARLWADRPEGVCGFGSSRVNGTAQSSGRVGAPWSSAISVSTAAGASRRTAG